MDLQTYCSVRPNGIPCPMTEQAWCTVGSTFSAMGSGTSCNGLSWVGSMASIDQGIDFFYDSSGKLTAVAGWQSDPSQHCNGACTYVCLGGPPSFDANSMLSCTNGGVAGASAVCSP